MILYRIAKCPFVADLSGTGSRLFGGRWNSVGNAAIYLASSRSLAVLEVLVHLPPLVIPDNLCIVELDVPNDNTMVVDVRKLPANWRDISQPAALAAIGNKFIKDGKYLALKVPSCIVPDEYNYILNPLHPDMVKVTVIKKGHLPDG